MGIYVFRHGDSEYRQGKVDISIADDLLPIGVKTVRESAKSLAQRLTGDGEDFVRLRSSPFGRCLYTAKVLKEALKEQGIDSDEIETSLSLEEVRNLDWKSFYPLIVGGEVSYDGLKFSVDKDLTNPERLSPVRYFRTDAAHNLSEKARASLPLKYLDRLDITESYKEVAARFKNFALTLMENERDLVQNMDPIEVLVTHEGLTGDFIVPCVGNPEAYLARGKFFELKYRGKVLITSVPRDAVAVD
jgi:broad specificity phosphatase PhoE